MVKFITINETAKTGILPEWALRRMCKEGRLPGVYSGTRFYVNYQALEEMLIRESTKMIAEEVI